MGVRSSGSLTSLLLPGECSVPHSSLALLQKVSAVVQRDPLCFNTLLPVFPPAEGSYSPRSLLSAVPLLFHGWVPDTFLSNAIEKSKKQKSSFLFMMVPLVPLSLKTPVPRCRLLSRSLSFRPSRKEEIILYDTSLVVSRRAAKPYPRLRC